MCVCLCVSVYTRDSICQSVASYKITETCKHFFCMQILRFSPRSTELDPLTWRPWNLHVGRFSQDSLQTCQSLREASELRVERSAV